MSEESLLTTILLIGIGLGLAVKFLLNNIAYHWANIKAIWRNNAEFAKKQAEVEKMKANGDFHEWVSIPSVNGTMLVCKKTGYTPSLNGFVPVEMIASYLERVKREEEYKEFRNARVAALAQELNFDLPKMERIVEQIFSMKKDFTVLKLEQLSQDLSKRAQNVGNQDKI
jgi:hypothetical protein